MELSFRERHRAYDITQELNMQDTTWLPKQ